MSQSPQQLSDLLDSIKEEPQFDSGDKKAIKEQDKVFGEHNRSERLKNVTNWAFIFFVVVASVILVGVFAVRMAHLAISPQYQWLTNDQIQSIDKLFFSGAVGGVLANYYKKVNN